MSTETVMICDVFPAKKNVRKVWIRTFVGEYGDDTPLADMHEKSSRHCDMSEAAFERAMKFIDRGIVPPTKKGATDGDDRSS